MRVFDGGATRDDDNDKFDYDGFLCPLALRRYAEYLHKHRVQADGEMRASDNWQNGQGIPLAVYTKSLWRHFIDFWTFHRFPDFPGEWSMQEALCAIIFNAFGYLHELEKAKREGSGSPKEVAEVPDDAVITIPCLNDAPEPFDLFPKGRK